MKNKLLALLLAVLMVVSLLPVTVLAEPQQFGEPPNLTWELTEEDTVLTISGDGPMSNFEDPSDRPWNESAMTIETVIIESGVMNIGKNAFTGFTGLTSVTIPAGVTEIREGAFSGCEALTGVTFAESSQLTSIKDFAFCASGLTEITIPEAVTEIGSCAFSDCNGLTTITVNAEVPPNLSEKAIPENVTAINVPAGTVDAYKSAWEAYSDKIVGPATHDLSVTKSGGATEGVDYEWDDTVLNILTSGLTVSGNTTTETIVIPKSATVTDLTFKDLTINIDRAKIACSIETESLVTTLYLSGTNYLHAKKDVFCAYDLTIDGDGLLTVAMDESGSTEDGLVAMTVGNFILEGGTVELIAAGNNYGGLGDASGYTSQALIANGNVTLAGGSLTAKGGQVCASATSFGVYMESPSTLTVTGGHHTLAGYTSATPVAPDAKVVKASTNYDGSADTTYVAANIATYKYLELEAAGAAASATYHDVGKGTSDEPWEISTLEQLNDLAAAVNGTGAYAGDADDMSSRYFKLTADIGTTEKPFTTPIGADESTPFEGDFDGDGHTVTLGINGDFAYAGLFGYFGYIGTHAKVKNVTTAGSIAVTHTGESFVGGICGWLNAGEILNCHNGASVSVTSTKFSTSLDMYCVGGINGYMNTGAFITNCYNSGNISSTVIGTGAPVRAVGGVCGANFGSIENCYSSGTITTTGDAATMECYGGVCGFLNGIVKSSYYDKSVYTAKDTTTGVTGLVTAQMQTAAGATYSGTGTTMSGKALVDLLNGSHLPTSWLEWTVKSGEYPTFKVETPAHTHDGVTFEPWDSDNSLPAEGGNWYLTKDVTLTDAWSVPSSGVSLCLNGHVITAASNKDAIWNNSTLIIYDCSNDKTGKIDGNHVANTGIYIYDGGRAELQSGTICGFKSAAVNVETGAIFNLAGGVIRDCSGKFGAVVSRGTVNVKSGSIKDCSASEVGGAIAANAGKVTIDGGIIENCSATTYGGAVYIASGTTLMMKSGTIASNTSCYGGGVFIDQNGAFIMLNGVICNNKADKNQGGGGVWVNGNFTMSNGEISGNAAKSGAGVYVYGDNAKGTDTDAYFFTMAGGSIKNNVASDKGGGVYVDNYDVGFKMLDGEISGNSAGSIGGGVCCNTAITLGGKAKVTGNTVSDKANNVYLRTGRGSASIFEPIINISNLKSGASIGLTTQKAPDAAAPVQITANGTADDVKYFSADDSQYSVDFDTDHLVLKVPAHVHDFTYSATDNVLTATCKATDCDLHATPTTLTLTTPTNLVYDNTAKELTFASGEESAWTAAGCATPSDIVYYLKDGTTETTTANSGAAENGKAPVNAGKYVAKVTAGEATATKQFTIAKKAIDKCNQLVTWYATKDYASGDKQIPVAFTVTDGMYFFGTNCGFIGDASAYNTFARAALDKLSYDGGTKIYTVGNFEASSDQPGAYKLAITWELPDDYKTNYYIDLEIDGVIMGTQTAPGKGEGYSIAPDFKITVESGYEVNDAEGFTGTTIATGDTLVENNTYYIRKAKLEYYHESPATAFVAEVNNCEYTETVSLTEGTFGMKLGGKDMGWFKFEAVDGGWKIMKTAKPGLLGTILNPYLAVKDGKLTYTDSDNATIWTYKNGAFSASVKTTKEVKTSYGILGWLFGFGGKTTKKDVTTTYYLSTVTDGQKLSTNTVKAELYTEASGAHEYGNWIDCKDGANHKRMCKHCGEWETEAHSYDPDTHKCVCGAYDPSVANVKISVDVTEKTTKQFSGFLFWGTWKDVTTYTATIKTEATGVKVTKVQYQLGGGRWTTGTKVSSNKPIETLKVKAWDNTGKLYEYTYTKSN